MMATSGHNNPVRTRLLSKPVGLLGETYLTQERKVSANGQGEKKVYFSGYENVLCTASSSFFYLLTINSLRKNQRFLGIAGL